MKQIYLDSNIITLPYIESRRLMRKTRMVDVSERLTEDHYFVVITGNCCQSCVTRIPYATLIATVMCLIGVGIFCGTMYRGTSLAIIMFDTVFHIRLAWWVCRCTMHVRCCWSGIWLNVVQRLFILRSMTSIEWGSIEWMAFYRIMFNRLVFNRGKFQREIRSIEYRSNKYRSIEKRSIKYLTLNLMRFNRIKFKRKWYLIKWHFNKSKLHRTATKKIKITLHHSIYLSLTGSMQFK